MPKLSDTTVPAYRHHKASGQAIVSLNGRDVYLGPWKSAPSKAEYNRVIAEWMAAGRRIPVDPASITVAEVALAFRKHAQTYYKDADGTVSKATINFDESMRPVLKLFGKTRAIEFGPLRLKAVRAEMIKTGRVRTNVNRHITRVRGVFKWAVENELIPASVHHGLMAVSGLRSGRCEAKESEPVKPVPIAHVGSVRDHVSPQVKAMIDLQLLTGMRPGEVVIMRTADIDTTGALWVYRPQRHKTQSHGHSREVYLGPKAQAVLGDFLKPELAAYIFSPADADRARREALHAKRKTPMSCGNRPGSNVQRKPERKPGERYNPTTYYRAVIRGCDAAFPPPAEMVDPAAIDQWRKEHRWHPHQIRHTAATEMRKTHGLEAAQVILGHKTLTVTQVYAEKNVAQAMKIMAAIG